MFVVLGASGHTGQVVAKTLLERGQKVRAVGRSAEHLQPLATSAEIAIADATNATALTNAFQGAEAAYVLIPPNVGANDVSAYQEKVSDAIAAAVRSARLKYVVALSSIGADKSSGTGPVVGLHNLEKKLSSIEGLNALFLRAGYFMENTLPQIAAIHAMGSVVGPLKPTLKLPMIATRDIGIAAADALLRRDVRGKQTRELQGQRDIDYTEVAAILGKAINKPSLAYVHAPDDQIRPAMTRSGMSQNFIDMLLEMAHALNSGEMKALEPRTAENTTPTPYENFVQEEFVPAYRQQMAA
ncbi:MAG TPA: NmrA family NAD(P)-binding protein [Candidatus Sulfotelmatobacter sp.]|nr:NmrA family NAD(P)-binding protein [Candidatus Sulfotelmatobacter sp.]